MLDGIKLQASIDSPETWKDLVHLTFITKVNTATGDIDVIESDSKEWHTRTYSECAKHRNYYLELKYVEKRNNFSGLFYTNCYLTLRGSLHKSASGGNHTVFHWVDVQKEINRILTLLRLNPEDVRVLRLEMGVNILVPINAREFISKYLICYKNKSFNSYNDKNGYSIGKYCQKSQTTLKVYSKGEQYVMNDELLRFEVAFTKMQKLRGFGINTLKDLEDFHKICNLSELLLTAWDAVLLDDPTIDLDNCNLTKKERELLLSGKNPRYWESLRAKGKNAISYKKRVYQKLILQYGGEYHSLIRYLIKREWLNLFN